MPFDPTEYARREIAPLMRALCRQAEEDGEVAQQAYFERILAGIEGAGDGADLADSFMGLSQAAFLGFQYSAPVAALLDRALMHAQQLSESLSLEPGEIH